MKKFFSYKEILPIAMVVFSAIIGALIYSKLPQTIPSHWNASGVIDSWMEKNMAVLFFPGLILLIYFLMVILPFVDPLKKNYRKFLEDYFWFRTITLILLFLLYLFSLLVAVGFEVNIIYFIIPVMSVYIIYLGFFLPNVKRNYFVGVRTPWTIYSDKVWDKTHEFSGKLFIIAGLLSILGLFNLEYAFAIFLSIFILAAITAVSYSYYIFLKVGKK
jgi:uncharacterized membrane protein